MASVSPLINGRLSQSVIGKSGVQTTPKKSTLTKPIPKTNTLSKTFLPSSIGGVTNITAVANNVSLNKVPSTRPIQVFKTSSKTAVSTTTKK